MDEVLNAIRSTLMRRGPKGLFRLIRAFEDSCIQVWCKCFINRASAHVSLQVLKTSNLRAPLPAGAFTNVLRDASLGLSQRQTDLLRQVRKGDDNGELTNMYVASSNVLFHTAATRYAGYGWHRTGCLHRAAAWSAAAVAGGRHPTGALVWE